MFELLFSESSNACVRQMVGGQPSETIELPRSTKLIITNDDSDPILNEYGTNFEISNRGFGTELLTTRTTPLDNIEPQK